MRNWEEFVRAHLPEVGVRPEREHEIVAELALQLDQAYHEALDSGLSETDALQRAEEQFADWGALAAEIRRAEQAKLLVEPSSQTGKWLTGFWRDILYALRYLRKNPGFAAVSVLTLAFGIGGNTAIFTLVDGLVLRSLPYPEPTRLMTIETRKAQQPEVEAWTSAPDFFDLRQQAKSFSSMAGISPVWNLVLTGYGSAERLEGLFVSADFFPLTGVQASLGRVFGAAEDKRAQPANVVVISHALWQRRFGSRKDVLGKALRLDSSAYTVIGVMPADFQYLGEPVSGTASQIDVWFPLADNQLTGSARSLRFLKVIGKLKPGVSVAQAADEVGRLGIALETGHQDTNRGYSMHVQPLSEQVTGRIRLTMLLLLGAIGFVLLMACANVASLLLGRAVTRQREIAVRVALGASSGRLLRQLLTEGLVLALIGGVVALPVAWASLRFLVSAGPQKLVGNRPIQLDVRALLFTAAIVLAAAILAGLPPAVRTLAGVGSALREAGRGLVAGHHRWRAALVTGQIALALVLLVGSGLLIRSFQRLLEVNPGFNPHNLVTISTQMPGTARTPEQRTAIYRLVKDQLMRVPGVAEVAVVSRLPMSGRSLGSWASAEGKSTTPADVEYRVATPSYFATMQIPLRAGRLYDEHDMGSAAASIVVINESMARMLWAGDSAIGKRIKLGSNPERQPWITVIGVVGDIRHVGLETEPRAELYRPYVVNPLSAPIVVVRTRVDPTPMIGSLSDAIRAVNPDIPRYDIFPMEALVDRSTRERRFVMLLLSAYAVASMLLAGVGIYGTMSQSVVQRTAEIGVRMALGASPMTVLWLLFRQGLHLVVAGIVAGTVAAVALTRLMRSILFGVGPGDPWAFIFAAVVLATFAMVACYVPARRATRVDPVVALRQE